MTRTISKFCSGNTVQTNSLETVTEVTLNVILHLNLNIIIETLTRKKIKEQNNRVMYIVSYKEIKETGFEIVFKNFELQF